MTVDTEKLMDTATKLKRIAELSQQNHKLVFNNLMHLFNMESLRGCFRELEGRKALGTDGISKDRYGMQLEGNLQRLLERMKRMAYIPTAVRQVLIPKEGKAGATRALGISNLEDKIIQKMMQKVLESMYEPLFKDCSYGFRPNRSCHTAIKVLDNYLSNHEVEAVIDVDISNFFGSIDHEMLLNMLRSKISDSKFIRYVARMFKAGILTDGELTTSDEGVPQGSICSPILANIFAHHVIDTWIEEEIKPRYKAELFRYADDIVIVSRYQSQAEQIKIALQKRLADFKLKLNEDKTRLVKFSKAEAISGVQQESFDFLGFTFYLGRTRKGKVMPKLKTNGKRMRAKLKKVNQWARKMRSRVELNTMWKIAITKLRGHIQYYGVSHNSKQIAKFKHKVRAILFKWINRRGDCRSMTWKEFELFEIRNPLPKAIIYAKLF